MQSFIYVHFFYFMFFKPGSLSEIPTIRNLQHITTGFKPAQNLKVDFLNKIMQYLELLDQYQSLCKMVWRTLITSCYEKLINSSTKLLKLYDKWLFL